MGSGVRQAFKIADALSKSPSAGFNELRRELDGLPAATLSRLLKDMLETGWAERLPDGSYCCGPASIAAARRLSAMFSVENLLRPVVRALAEETGESAAFAVWEGAAFCFRVKHEIPESFHYIDAGVANDDMANSFFKVCLAFQPEPVLARMLRRHSPEEIEEWRKNLSLIKGQALSLQRDRALRVISPVFQEGRFAGALGVTALRQELKGAEGAHVKRAVLEKAAQASEALSRRIQT